MDEGIYYVLERYNDLFDLLKDWGYEPTPDPDFDNWQEIVRSATQAGHIKVTGTRDQGDGTALTFKFEEFWVKGDRGEEAVIVREDGSLWGYAYHGQAPTGGMRGASTPRATRITPATSIRSSIPTAARGSPANRYPLGRPWRLLSSRRTSTIAAPPTRSSR